MYEWLAGWLDGWMDGWMDRDGEIDIQIYNAENKNHKIVIINK